MQRRTFLLHLHFHDFLRVVPGPARIRHKNRLIQSKNCDRNQIPDKKERLDERKRKRPKENRDENVQHAFLRVLCADGHHLLAVFHRRLLHALQLDIRLDEFHRAISSRGNRLRRSPRKPINHCAAGDQHQKKRRMQQRKLIHVLCNSVGQRHNDRKNHCRSADHSCPNQHRLGRSLESISRPIILLEQFLSPLEIHIHIEITLQFLLDVRNRLDQRKLVHRLRVVRHRPIRIHRDRYRPHSQKSKRHQTKRKHRRRNHQIPQPLQADQVADGHQQHHRKADVISRKIASYAPPSSADATTSRTCRDSVEVNTFTNSGIIAPARVPQEIIVESFHHRLVSPFSTGTIFHEIAKVIAIETSEVIHTSEVSGDSKFILSAAAKRALEIKSFKK